MIAALSVVLVAGFMLGLLLMLAWVIEEGRRQQDAADQRRADELFDSLKASIEKRRAAEDSTGFTDWWSVAELEFDREGEALPPDAA